MRNKGDAKADPKGEIEQEEKAEEGMHKET